MAAVLRIDDVEMPPARVTGEVMRALLETDLAGAFERMELIDGVLIEMTPARNPHAIAHAEIAFALRAAVPEGTGVLIDPRLYLGTDSMLGPDIVVARAGLGDAELAPEDILLTVEIAAATLEKDIGRKAALYGTHGVPEYWVVDLVSRRLHVHREPGAQGYGSVTVQDWAEPARARFDGAPELDLASILRDIG